MINISYTLSRQDYWKLARNPSIIPLRAKNELDDWAIAASIVKFGRVRACRNRMSNDELAWWNAIDHAIWLVRLIRSAEDEDIREDRIASLRVWCKDVTADSIRDVLRQPSETIREIIAIAMEAVELCEELYPFALDWCAGFEKDDFWRAEN